MIVLKRILVATDFGEVAEVALDYGRALAAQFGATLHVLHVAQNLYLSTIGTETFAGLTPRLQQEVENAARKGLEELLIDSDGSGPPTKARVLTGTSPALVIVGYAKDNSIDLIVIGTHGRGALAHIITGSVAERVVRLAPCPVLTVKHPEHEFVTKDTLMAVAHAKA